MYDINGHILIQRKCVDKTAQIDYTADSLESSGIYTLCLKKYL
jgi:hypothetical protein